MILPDYHLHTCFSGDCETPVEELINKAIAMGMESIAITDHNDLDFPDTPDKVTFDLDIDNYIKELVGLRDRYRDRIRIKIGVEQGVMQSTCNTLDSYTKEHPGIDFVICSSHVVNGMDPYYPEAFYGNDEKAVYRTYFEEILYNVTHFNDYSVYGHIDYILRYGPTKGDNFVFNEYEELFREIFKNIIMNGKGIEINTGSLYRGLTFMHPQDDILRCYKDLEGEIITVGSDSHDLNHIGYAFDNAKQRLLKNGFRYYTEFTDMKPEFKKL